ncbi:MAG TPA: M20/M25/M40 family metallo-hydrolase [bacterium]|nr:M20/M25/M40 family metallo-hydrolase [bacterium]HQO35838.1 M20/M25/M40 family metallo-hydrolase [bacterium]HQP98018.1 M20/M25/M40 family metallo-hydrolase [bacterium]
MELLRKLCEASGVAGREERIREIARDHLQRNADEITVDTLGNLIALKKAKSNAAEPARKVMLACHMDEIGFYVKHIDDKGFIRVVPLGGFDTRNLFARRVLIQGKRDVIGIMNPCGRPIHMLKEEDKKKTYDVDEFFVDVFMKPDEMKEIIRVGDPVTLFQPFHDHGDVVSGKAMDNRVAVWVGLNVMKNLGSDSAFDVYMVGAVQEEVGTRGSGPSCFGLDPDVGIAIDVTLACDTPGVEPDHAVTRMGEGVAIKIMDSYSISHRGLVDSFVKTAESNKIPFQMEILPRGGTDAGPMQRTGIGRPVITISVPCRYVHTVVESVQKKDLQGAVDLLTAWLKSPQEWIGTL